MQPRSRGGEQDVAKPGKKNSLPASLFSGSCLRCRGRLGGEWRRQKIRCGGGSRYATQWKLMTKMPPPPGRRGQDGACGREPDELELEPWVSLWSNHFGEESTPPVAWTEGNKMPPAPPGRRGTSDQIHCGGGARSGTRRGCGKIVASEDFASFLIYVFVRSSFSPLGFFLSFALPGICVHYCPGLAVGLRLLAEQV